MPPLAADQNSHGTTADFIATLSSFSRLHRAQRWEGTFGEFLANILPGHAVALARTSHEYVWDMLRWHGRAAQPDAPESVRARELFKRELFGIDEPLSRVVDYFKAAAESEGGCVGAPGERVFLTEAPRIGIGPYAPPDPTPADIADLVGSVDLAKVAQIGDEGDPRAWSWSGAVYAASRGVLEMIEILKVKREFLYLLLTLTQEKNVKVSRFPLIHLDETILAHTNLAEFHKFLQEKENEALLDRMVIIKIPYALSYRDESRIYQKLVSGAPAFRNVHLDPHVLNLAAVFAILTRLHEGENEGLDPPKKLRLYAGEAVEGVPETEVIRLHAETPEEGMTGVSPRFVVNAISNAITRGNTHSLTSMELLLALKDSIESDARMDAKQKKAWIDHLVTARKEFYNRWVKEDVHRAMFASFEEEAQQLLEKYLDEVEASLDHRQGTDPITGESRPAAERFLPSVEERSTAPRRRSAT